MVDIKTCSLETISKGNLWNGVVLEKWETLELSEQLAKLYIDLIEYLSLNYFVKHELQQNSLQIILRTAIVPITHCFFERLIRLNKIVKVSKCKPRVEAQGLFLTPNTIEEFHENVGTEQFNQSIISLLSEVWGLECINSNEVINPNEVINSNLKLSKAFKNNLFKINSKFSIYKLLGRIDQYTKWLPPLGRFPVLTLSNSTGAFRKRFFYLRNFKVLDECWLLEPVTVDLGLRRVMFNESQLALNAINSFLSNYSFSDKQKKIVTRLYFEFVKASFPLQFLEGFQNNCKSARRALLPFKAKALLFSGEFGTRSTFILGIAKSMGFKLICAQHGGYYGYLKDISVFLESEWAKCDVFITWGWTKLPNHPAIMQMLAYPLPSPWLSERKFYWKDLVIGFEKPFDILWMPNQMRTYTAAPQGASSIRRDVIDDFAKLMIDFVKIATKSKIRVYCKPYNPTTVYLMSTTYDTMSDIGGNFFELADNFDKGLSYELLNKSKLVLWDQPGTGFMECIACNIPTIVLWPRTYSEEEAWCINDFKCLEEVGLIHRTVESLINEIQCFLINPVAWISDSQRKLAIQNFANKYALTDDQWWKTWRIYFKQLINEINENY